MPMRNKRVKRETRIGEFSEICKEKEDVGIQLSQLPVAGQGMSSVLVQPLTSTLASFEDGNCLPSCRMQDGGDRAGNSPIFVPVRDKNGKPLMLCHPARARELVRKGRAVRRFLKGIFYIRLLGNTTSSSITQPVACGIDPGSKKEGFTVKSKSRTYLNLQADAITWVSDAVKTRREMRRGRRYRKTPYRSNRKNRARGELPPSTKARWDWKLRLAQCLCRLYPISIFVVEDIKAKTKGQQRWDKAFSPLEVGKAWFYKELSHIAAVRTKSGWETKLLRDQLGLKLKKSGDKTANIFEAHAIDSWMLASSEVGGELVDSKSLLLVVPLRFHRRQLHLLQASKGGIRRAYGGSRSLGFRRGSYVKHLKYGIVYVGGVLKDRISLHSIKDGRRLCQNAKPTECNFLTYSSWRVCAA